MQSSGKKTPASAIQTIMALSTQKKKQNQTPSLKPVSCRSRSRSKSRIEERQLPDPLSLLAKFDLVTALQNRKGSANVPPTISALQQTLLSKAYSAEVFLKSSSMIEAKREEIILLESEIKKLKKSILLQKAQKENNTGMLKDAIKECKKLADKLEKKILDYKSVNKKKQQSVASCQEKVLEEEERLENVANSQSRMDAEIALLLSSTALELPINKTASIEVLVEQEQIRESQNQARLQLMAEEKRELTKLNRNLHLLVDEVNRFKQANSSQR